MRNALQIWVRRRLGTDLLACRTVAGGCIHTAWALELADGRRLFAKTNTAVALPLLQAEVDGLEALRRAAAGELVIPAPLHCDLEDGTALLTMDWLDLGSRSGGEAWEAAGAALARLHRRSLEWCPAGPAFGWSRDNFIGSGPQPNGWSQDWGRFFTEQRLEVQLRIAGGRGRRFSGAERLLARTADWLNGHGADPCLVHGDLWSGNTGLLGQGPVRAALFDPAVYRGDREVDLAMARLFGGLPPALFRGYEHTWPLPQGWRFRSHLYNLYHLLNHANLFGGGYGDQAQAVIDGLLAGKGAAAER